MASDGSRCEALFGSLGAKALGLRAGVWAVQPAWIQEIPDASQGLLGLRLCLGSSGLDPEPANVLEDELFRGSGMV